MSKLLYIETSPRGENSFSSRVARAFLESWRENNSESEVDHLDLWKSELPPFEQNMLNAKYAVLNGNDPQEGQVAAWSRIEQIADRFKAADIYLFSVPMWNFTIPYSLKHYFDLIIQPGITFNYSPDSGYSGLVTGKKAILAYARGGAYSEGSGMEDYDFQTSLLETLLGFIGITDIKRIVVEPTVAPSEISGPALEKAQEEARQAAEQY